MEPLKGSGGKAIMFSTRTRRIRDGLAVAILVSALVGAGASTAVGAPPAAIADKSGGMSAAVCDIDKPSPGPVDRDRPRSRMLPLPH